MTAHAITYQDADWTCVCLPRDGGRISRLAYRGVDLLTIAPQAFRAPPAAQAFERRPVYGYDDCFPAVAAGVHPTLHTEIPDHGACWSKDAATILQGPKMESRFEFPEYAARLIRRLEFAPERIHWHFRVENDSEAVFPCQHVMHALMPPSAIGGLHLPDYASAVDTMTGRAWPGHDPLAIAHHLLATPTGEARMLLLHEIQDGRCVVHRRDGLTLTVDFPSALFPTLGIWWDRGGYPAAPGEPRDECAFEPVPGPSGSLDAACATGTALRVPARGRLAWTITWHLAAR